MAFLCCHESEAKKKQTNIALSARVVAKISSPKKAIKPLFVNKTLVFHGFDVNLNLLKAFELDQFFEKKPFENKF